jgi:hypothetical protein
MFHPKIILHYLRVVTTASCIVLASPFTQAQQQTGSPDKERVHVISGPQCGPENMGDQGSAFIFLMEVDEGRSAEDYNALARRKFQGLNRAAKCAHGTRSKLYLLPPELFATCSKPESNMRDRDSLHCAESPRTLGVLARRPSGDIWFQSQKQRADRVQYEARVKENQQQAREALEREKQGQEQKVNQVAQLIQEQTPKLPAEVIRRLATTRQFANCSNESCKEIQARLLALPISSADRANGDAWHYVIFRLLRKSNNSWSLASGCLAASKSNGGGWKVEPGVPPDWSHSSSCKRFGYLTFNPETLELITPLGTRI